MKEWRQTNYILAHKKTVARHTATHTVIENVAAESNPQTAPLRPPVKKKGLEGKIHLADISIFFWSLA